MLLPGAGRTLSAAPTAALSGALWLERGAVGRWGDGERREEMQRKRASSAEARDFCGRGKGDDYEWSCVVLRTAAVGHTGQRGKEGKEGGEGGEGGESKGRVEGRKKVKE